MGSCHQGGTFYLLTSFYHHCDGMSTTGFFSCFAKFVGQFLSHLRLPVKEPEQFSLDLFGSFERA